MKTTEGNWTLGPIITVHPKSLNPQDLSALSARQQVVSDTGRAVMMLEHDDSEEGNANATLMAASKDLLAALKEAHFQLTGTTSNMPIKESDFPIVVSTIRSAIAKAQGK